MPLTPGTEVGLGQGNTVLDEDADASRKGAQQTLLFRPIVAKRLPISATAELLYCVDVTIRFDGSRCHSLWR